jgi:hypothetical protein
MFSSADVTRIQEFYGAQTTTTIAQRMGTGVLMMFLVLLSFVPAALVLVPLFWLYYSVGLNNSMIGSILYGLLFLQPLGVAITIGFKRYSQSLLPIDPLLNHFDNPPFHFVPIWQVASGGCRLVNGCEHSVESSPAIFYIISGNCCGSNNLLTMRQLWTLIALEACACSGYLVALSGTVCILLPSDADFFILMILSLILPFGWYALFKYLMSTFLQDQGAVYDSTPVSALEIA